MTFIRRLMEIKEKQLGYELVKIDFLLDINRSLKEILKVLQGGKDGKHNKIND